jgi:nitroreductase
MMFGGTRTSSTREGEAMEFQDVIRKRRMVRNYSEQPVPPGALDRMLSNAVRAPSAGFSQGWAFLVLEDEPDRARFWDIEWPLEERTGPHAGIVRAPVLILPLSNKQAYLDRYAEPDKGWTDRDEARWPMPFWHIDTGFAALLILLTAVDEGLGALFFGVRRGDAVRAAFGIPNDYEPIGGITVGFAAPDAPSPSLARGRRTDVVHWGRW